ncbi:4-(cytidine 5'-diphospho)-2-C-methyl-D-erythritol kinase [Spirochaeta isovalerica]|uniref:4-diphosphocytidyl-2-C-methyl-D-erythritol kinase n=1 Tax=Spirochaeta isovalerica TaxID=150 RepID=A0A841R973_9SPIO|nr:4-diphosphocytidyl-2-C-methyl-D-erythritol kinase [Spirochaeta isovalerica]
MSKIVRIDSPAKINLHLDIFDRREDGFHDLFSVFQMISLYDHIEIREGSNGGTCSIDGPFDFPVQDNLMYKAVTLFRRATGYSEPVHIRIVKNIPQGGGLGGGSGNAAAVLRALESLSGITIPRDEIFDLGASLGSDVPFFLGSPAALVRGRGEYLEPIEPRTDYFLLLVVPDFSINTGQAFNALARFREKHKPVYPLSEDEVLKMYREGEISRWKFHNSFLNCLKKEHNVLEHIVNLFYYSNADFAGMSGSGSVMFGIFSRQEDCVSASEKLSESFGRMIFANPLDTAMVAALQFS